MVASATGVSLAVPLRVLIALLYLLTEVHEKPETTWGTAASFMGFLAMTVISEMM